MHVNRSKSAVHHLNYHLVWCPKYRRSVLTAHVAGRLHALLHGIAAQHGLQVLACEVMPDHVHLFLSAPPRYSPANLARLFKGVTSRYIRQELNDQIRHSIHKPGTLWSPSDYVGTAGNVSAQVIARYIEQSQRI